MAKSYPISRWSSELTGERRKRERKKERKVCELAQQIKELSVVHETQWWKRRTSDS